MNKADAYYEPQDYDDRTDEIEERTWQLMKPGQTWDYRTTTAIGEAISELSVDAGNALQEVIDTGDYAQIGRKIMFLALDYYEQFARSAAESEIND